MYITIILAFLNPNLQNKDIHSIRMFNNCTLNFLESLSLRNLVHVKLVILQWWVFKNLRLVFELVDPISGDGVFECPPINSHG